MTTGDPGAPRPAEALASLYTYRARPLWDRGYDGDTLWVTWDMGHRVHADVQIRLEGVFAPERREPGSWQAALFLRDWVEAVTRDWPTWPLHVRSVRQATKITDQRDGEVVTFTRYVGRVFDPPEQVCLNTALSRYLEANPQWGRGTGGT